jgi:hypothetical protein
MVSRFRSSMTSLVLGEKTLESFTSSVKAHFRKGKYEGIGSCDPTRKCEEIVKSFGSHLSCVVYMVTTCTL